MRCYAISERHTGKVGHAVGKGTFVAWRDDEFAAELEQVAGIALGQLDCGLG
jgi:hypothetical protein